MMGSGPTMRRGSLVSRIVHRFRARPDSEHEMRFNGLVLSTATLIYLFVSGNLDVDEFIVFTAYIAFTLLILGHILLRPGASNIRRTIAMLGDFGALFCEMYIRGEAASFLFPLYYWVVLGNGFRFGIPFLALATGIGLAFCGAMIAVTPFWAEHTALAIGFIGGLILLPFYAAVLIRKLSKAKQQAEEASQAKSMFLASVSHELRTPLTAIIGMGSVLHDTRLDPSQREMTRTVVSAGQQLLTLINDILDFSRIEAGQMTVQAADFDLPSVLAEMRAMVLAQARPKGLHVAIHIDRRVPLRLRGSERHLKEIVLNLLGNAVKFTEAGSVVVAVRPETGPGDRVWLRFEVSDTGIGIAPEASAHIFESFRQADASIMDRFGGTGLGLAICKRLVIMLGGEIGVDSTPGAGSTFWFTLGFDPAWEAEALTAAEPIPDLGVAVGDTALVGRLMPLLAPAARTIETFGTVDAALAWHPLRSAAAVLIMDRRILPSDPAHRAPILAVLRSSTEARAILLDAPAAEGDLPRDLKEAFVTALPRDADAGQIAAAFRIAQAGRPPGKQEAAAIRRQSGSGRKLSILVADDNRMNQKVLREILTRAGHQVQLAANGEEALDALDIGTFDLVLMDINMPVMNGIEATKLYRFTALDRPRIPIVALTADATAGVAARCAEAGMDACLTKPIEPETLLAAIDDVLDGQAPVAEPPPEVLPENVKTLPQAGPGAVDMRVLDRLEALGGADFLVELINDFLADVETVAADLQAAAQSGDAQQFRSNAHALRSATANIGARGLSDLCRDWQGIGAADLARNGPAHIRRLTAEIERVRPILLRRREATARSATSS